MTKRVLAPALLLLLLLVIACAPAAGPGGGDGPDTADPSLSQDPDESPGDPDDSTEGDPPSDDDGLDGEGQEEDGARMIDPEKPMVALTYDDGPHATYTDMLLDILEENRAVATFFEVGRNLYNDADAVRRAEALGCEVGSHSYRHADLGKLSAEAILDDLAKADANFVDVLGHKPNLLRPPYGSLSNTLRSVTGRSLIAWSVDSEDWLSRDVDKILASVQGIGDLNGQVILMHSTYDTSVEASRVLIPWLIEQGYQLVTVTELINLHYGEELVANGLYNYEYFHFGFPVSLPASGSNQVPAAAAQPPVSVPDTPSGAAEDLSGGASEPSTGDPSAEDGSTEDGSTEDGSTEDGSAADGSAEGDSTEGGSMEGGSTGGSSTEDGSMEDSSAGDASAGISSEADVPEGSGETDPPPAASGEE